MTISSELLEMHERMARQETTTNNIESELAEMREHMEQLITKVNELSNSLTHYKGFVGGIIFVFTCVGAFLKLIPINLGFLQK